MSIYKKYGVYKITCNINKMSYVGMTTNNFGDRWDSHKAKLRGGYHDNKNLQVDWDKYGELSFKFEVVSDLTGEPDEVVYEYEKLEILKHKNYNLSYNISDGKGMSGCRLSEKAKALIGAKNKINMTGRKASEETRKKMSESHRIKNEKMSKEEKDEFSRKVSEAKRLNPISLESRQKISNAMKGNKHGAKLSEDQVIQMRRMFEIEKKSVTQISENLGINRGTVDGIVKYRRWKDVAHI